MDKTIFLFGDATDSWVDGLDQVYKQAASTPWLKVFLEKLTNVVIAEARVNNLDRALQDSLGHFYTLQELGQRYRHDPDPYGVVQAILLHAVRAGTLLQWVKREPELLGPNSSSEWIGLSGGLLSVAAVAIAHDFDSLFEASLEAGRLILRVAKLASVKSRALEEKPGTWGWAVLGISPDDLRSALDQFQRTNGISKKAKVGVVGNGWSTIIGPPSVLDLFLNQSSAVKNLAKNSLTIQAGQHALDTTAADIEYMVGNNTDFLSRKLRWSPSQNLWGMDTPAAKYATWGDLLKDIVAQVLSRPLDITQVVNQVNSELSRVGANTVRILQPGTTSHAPYLATVLKKAGKQVSVQDHNSLFEPEEVTPGRIAIVGMAGRGPQSDNVDEFWDLIMSKRDLCTVVPKDRFDIDEYYCESHERGDQRCKMKIRYGCFMDNPGHFDSRFFHISPREALLMDPNHRQFLMSSYEALESAGYSDGQTRYVDHNRIASFFAQATDDWHKQTHPSLGCDSYTLQGIQRAFGPGRLAFSYNWEGGTYALDSACAGTTAAIHLASLGLLNKDIDMAVAGAANILSWPHSFTCLDDSGILSPTGNCKTWRDDADGYCRGDFVGAVVLKRLEDAVAHNDNILAVISASGRNHSGNSTSITTSDAAAQERLFRNVMLKANVTPDDINYVEMHGTGTQVGDPAEMGAIANLFKHRRRANGPLPVGGVKANFGHSEAAAGMAELLKSIKMFQTGIVPPQQGMPHPLNPKLPNLKDINVEIPSEPKPFKKPEGKPRRILLNNFDAAGGNACLLLEEYSPATKSAKTDPRTTHIIASSARTKAAYHANKARLVKWLRESPSAKLEDLAYTTTARRVHHPYRFATSVSSTQELINKLEANDTTSSATPLHQPVVFVYTGQGSHYAGMGAELYQTSAVFRETVDLAVSISEGKGFPAFLDIITNSKVDLSSKTAVQIQLSVITLELALTAFWRSVGIEPAIVMGHSLGEYAALHAAGVLSLADTLHLVGSRAQLLLDRCEAGSCSMVSVTAPLATVQERLAKLGPSSSCAVACINSPNATVVSGTAEDIAKFQSDITAQDPKVRARQLSIPYAFHSFQVDPILDDYTSLAGGVTFSAPKIPVASTLLGAIVDKPGVFDQEYLARQTRQPVSFVEGLKAVSSKLKDPVWIEVGPGPVCVSFVRQTLSPSPTKILHSIESTANNWASVSKTLASAYASGVHVDWLAFHAPFEKSLSLLTLPAYAWDLKDYWVTYTDKNTRLIEDVTAPEPVVAPYVPPLSTCAQYLVEKSIAPSNGEVSVTFRASLSDPGFLALIDNHKMQGVGLCSGSVFCDAALTVAKYALEYSTGDTKEVPARSLSLHDPELLAPLTRTLVGPDGELHTTARLESPTSDLVTVTFKAVPAPSSSAAPIDLGSMIVRLRDLDSLQREWDRTSFFIKSALEARISSSKSGEGHRLQPEVLYALFSKNVEFGAPFKRIQEGYVSRDYAEAAARVILEEDPSGSSFTFSPYWGEALAHLAGFMVNGNPEPRDTRMTHIVMGFSAVEQTVDFVPGREYLTYTRITKWEANTAFCDAYIFDKETGKLVMVCADLRYQEIPRVVWKNVLEGKAGGHGGGHGGGAVKKADEKAAKKSSAPTKAAAPVATPKKVVEATPAPAPKAQPAQATAADTKIFDTIIDAIVKATGTDPSEFTPETVLSELGVDSIMAIEIVSAVRDKTGVDLPATFAFEYPTVGDLRAEFVETGDDSSPADEPQPPAEPAAPAQRGISTPTSSLSSATSLVEKDSSEDDTDPTDISGASSDSGIIIDSPNSKPTSSSPPIDESLPAPSTRITLLQGRPKPNSKTPLYLMADGTGSIATYIHLPIFTGAASRPIYGVDSPYLRCPNRLTPDVGIPGAAKLVVEALLSHHPDPTRNFIIAGFSAGSTIAYEVTRQLAHAGRTVEGLLLMDLCSPRPDQGFLDEETVNRETDVGIKIFSSAAAIDDMWTSTGSTRDHLRVYLSAMRNYHPAPFTPSEAPLSAAVIWAEKGMINRVRSNPEAVKLLLENEIPIERYDGFMVDPKNGPFACFMPDKKNPDDLGPNGWDVFTGRKDILCLSMPGADHLDMPMPGHVHRLHERISEVLGFIEGRKGGARK